MHQTEAGTIMLEADRRNAVREELEQELASEASASDRPADADGVQMHILIPSLPIPR
jgi:hypothetical protein